MQRSKIDKDLLNLITSEEIKNVDCIILAKKHDILKNFLIEKEISILKEYVFINAFLVSTSVENLKSLTNEENVKFVSSISSASMLMQISKKILGINTSLAGKDVTIAYIDTGIHPHLDFLISKNRIIYFKDFVHDKKTPYDDNGHGTFVAGVGSGNGALSKLKYSGIAPKSNIVMLKALDKHGEASANRILDAMQWVYDFHDVFNIKVVCMSFGSEPLGYNDPIMLGAEALWREGLVVTVAAGNSGPKFETIKSPGISPQLITVGGFNDNRLDEKTYDKNFFEVAEFSSRGPAFRRYKPDIIAPSVGIISCGINEHYIKLSGTSVATPMLAGICALILEKKPNLRPVEVKRILLSSCQAITYNKNIEGFGIPNLDNIFSALDN